MLPNPEAENHLLFHCINNLIVILQMVFCHFQSKKNDFLNLLKNDDDDENVLETLINATKTKLIQVQDSTGETEESDELEDLYKTIGTPQSGSHTIQDFRIFFRLANYMQIRISLKS